MVLELKTAITVDRAAALALVVCHLSREVLLVLEIRLRPALLKGIMVALRLLEQLPLVAVAALLLLGLMVAETLVETVEQEPHPQ